MSLTSCANPIRREAVGCSGGQGKTMEVNQEADQRRESTGSNGGIILLEQFHQGQVAARSKSS